jgi:hypothetical protein
LAPIAIELDPSQEQQDVLNADYTVAIDVALWAGGASEFSEHAEQILDSEFPVAIEIAWVHAVTC